MLISLYQDPIHVPTGFPDDTSPPLHANDFAVTRDFSLLKSTMHPGDRSAADSMLTVTPYSAMDRDELFQISESALHELPV